MITEEAIKELTEWLDGCCGEELESTRKALRMAVDALKAEGYALERYADLCEYFKGCYDSGDSILHDKNEFRKWLYRMKWHVLECDKLAMQLEALKAQMDGDTISRQEAIGIVLFECGEFKGLAESIIKKFEELPSAPPEEAIPVAWLEEQAKWFESMDNAFAKIEANNIRVTIKRWRSEKDERSD